MNKRRIIVRAMAAAAAGSGLKVPFKDLLIQWLTGLQDDGITLTDKIYPLLVDPEPTLVEVTTFTTNGVDQYGTLKAPVTLAVGDVIQIELDMITATNPAYAAILAPTSSGLSGVYAQGVNQGRIQLRGLDNVLKSSNLARPFNENDGRVLTEIDIISNTEVAISLDGVYIENVTVNMEGVVFGRIGANSVLTSTTFINASFSKIAVIRGGVDLLNLAFEEGGEQFVIDRSGNGNDMTIANYVNPASNTQWTTADDRESTNHGDGFALELRSVEIDVILMVGQSNMSGGNSGGTAPAHLDRTFPQNFGLSYAGASWFDLERIEPASPTLFGPEMQAAYDMTQAGKYVCFVKSARGGTSMAVDWQKATGTEYTYFVAQKDATFAALTALGYTPNLREIWIMQGEADATTTAWADAYAVNLAQFRTDLVSDGVIDSVTPWRVAEINSGATTIIANWETVVTAQKNFASLYGSSFPTDAFDRPPLSVHYTPDGLSELGSAFYNEYALSEYQSPLGESPDRIIDGDFLDATTAWSVANGATLESGYARIYSATGSEIANIRTRDTVCPVTIGDTYLLDYEILVNVNGNNIGPITGANFPSSVGVHTDVEWTATVGYLMFKRFNSSPTDIHITNIEMRTKAVTDVYTVRAPSLSTGGAISADGTTITNTGCANKNGVHNGSECGVLQTATEWPATLPNPMYWQDYVDHPNGTAYLWLKFVQDPSCKVKEAGLYDHGALDPEVRFISTWETTSALQTLTVPTTGTGYDGTIEWYDSTGTLVVSATFSDADMTGLAQELPTAGIYTCKISGTFPRIYFANVGDKAFLRTVENIGSVGWSSFENSFYGCDGLTSVNEGDADVSGVGMWSSAFRNTPNLSSVTLAEIGTPTRLNKMFNFSGVTAVVVTGWDLSGLDSPSASLAEMFTYCTLNTTGEGGADELIIYFGAEHSAGRLPLDNAQFDLGNSKLSSSNVDVVAAHTALINAGWTITFGGWE